MAERKTDYPALQGPMLQAVLQAWGQAGRQQVIPIAGSSMRPLIRDGDQVLVAHGSSGVRRGDIVVFRRGHRLIAHRVLHISRGPVGLRFISKGDNTYHLDPAWSAHEVVGRVLAVQRGDRHLSLDTRPWRALGWLIASTTMVWTQLDGWSRDSQQRLPGPRPHRLTAVLCRSLVALSGLAWRVIHAVCCRWKGVVNLLPVGIIAWHMGV